MLISKERKGTGIRVLSKIAEQRKLELAQYDHLSAIKKCTMNGRLNVKRLHHT